jgi:hypothetical protein
VLPLGSFARDKSKRRGVKSICKECDRAKASAYYMANLEARQAYYRESARLRHRRHRERAVAVYGGCCGSCGADHGLLEFDHVDGGGEAHRAVESMRGYVARISLTGAPLMDVRLQLLCVPCHREKSNAEAWRYADVAR